MISLPKHLCSLTITHNNHKDYYQTLECYLNDDSWAKSWIFESEEHKQRAIKNDDVWMMQWYPNTPGGFYVVAAPTLEELLDFASSFNGVL